VIPNFQTILLNILQTGAFEMTLTKIYATAVITATILVIAAAATITTSFQNVTTVFATLQAPEQLGDNATTGTTPPETAGGAGQQQEQQQTTIHITKDGTNSYIISGEMSSVGSFDTTYRIAGERSAIRSAENLIISTITHDFRTSPIIGYVRAGGTTTDAGATPEPTLPSPFATPEQITERITSELRRVITEAENNIQQGQHVEIKCDFGMSLDEMRCHVPSVGAGVGGGAAATTATNTTDTTGTTTDDTTAPIAPLEGQ
jgi:hypothetical protein